MNVFYMDYQEKYLKYKKKYLECKEKYITCNIEQMKNSEVIGKGKFGMIVLPRNNNEIVYKLLFGENCEKAYNEYNMHSVIYDHLQKFSNLDELAYIPKPRCFKNIAETFPYIVDDKTTINVNCIYGMDYMKQLHYEDNNKIDEQYYQIQLGDNPEHIIGFRPNFETQGYYLGNIEELDKVLEKVNPLYNTKIDSFDIIQSMGHTFALIWFSAGYCPYDIQFILTENNGKIKVACYDFGEYVKIDEINSDEIIYEICNILIKKSGYLMFALDPEYPILKDKFLLGMQKIVIQINKENINKTFEKFKIILTEMLEHYYDEEIES